MLWLKSLFRQVPLEAIKIAGMTSEANQNKHVKVLDKDVHFIYIIMKTQSLKNGLYKCYILRAFLNTSLQIEGWQASLS
jgi:hypothetical protein